MARTKSPGAHRHRELRKKTKGFKQARRIRVRSGKEALLHAGQYAFAGRKLRKRDLRKLWIVRLNAAAREHGMKYSEFVAKLKTNKVELDRKILADIAVVDPNTFKAIISSLK